MPAEQPPPEDADRAQIRRLWPVTVLLRQLPEHKQVNAELQELFADYRRRHPTGNNPALYASPDNFAEGLEHPALTTLQRFIIDSVFTVARETNRAYWPDKLKLDVHLTGLWFQITNQHAFHEMHVHGNCSWSGVYYVEAGDASRAPDDRHANGMPNGITRFYGPHTEYLAAGHGDRGNLYLNDNTWDVYPENGKLVVFPSHLKHMVFPYQGERDRTIVSFHAVVDTPTPERYSYKFG